MGKKKNVLLGLAVVMGLTGPLNFIPSAVSAKSIKTITVEPKGNGENDWTPITNALKGGNVTVKLVPGKTYHIYGVLDCYSNTTLEATGAKIIEDKPGSCMVRQTRTRIEKKSLKGYSAVHDITVIGGTWVGTTKHAPDAKSKEGYKMGGNVMHFLHAKNITISNATLYNCYNAHLIEFTGVYNGKIENCTLGYHKNSSGKIKTGFYKGSDNNGCIQLDSCSGSFNNAHCLPYDGTPCKKIVISGNSMKYTTGIETAQRTKKDASYITIEKNKIRYRYKSYILKNVLHVKKKGNKVSKY